MARYLGFVAGIKQWVQTVVVSTGSADADKVPSLDATGKLDLSFIPDTEPFVFVSSSRDISPALHHRRYLNCNTSNAVTLTLVADSDSSPVVIQIGRNGVGTVTVALGLLSGITLNGSTTNKSIGTRYQMATLRRIAQNTWVMAVYGA